MTLLQQARAAIKQGDKAKGQRLLYEIVQQKGNQHKETAWLWLSAIVDNPERESYCLKQVLKINPKNEIAKKHLGKPEQPRLVAPLVEIKKQTEKGGLIVKVAAILVSVSVMFAAVILCYSYLSNALKAVSFPTQQQYENTPTKQPVKVVPTKSLWPTVTPTVHATATRIMPMVSPTPVTLDACIEACVIVIQQEKPELIADCIASGLGTRDACIQIIRSTAKEWCQSQPRWRWRDAVSAATKIQTIPTAPPVRLTSQAETSCTRGYAWDGCGDDVLNLPPEIAGCRTVAIGHAGDANFIVWALDQDSNQLDLIVNKIGNYSGLTLWPQGAVRISIESEGCWSIEFLP